VFDKYVGNSEGRIRQVFATAEAMAPCVLWIDEIEKSLTGDHEVTKRVKATMLTWMQEHTADVFLVATANEVGLLDAALLRRFNYVFWVDLPDALQRADIIRIQLRRKGRDEHLLDKDMANLVKLSDGFNGSGIEDWVEKAMLRAFNQDKADLETEDLVATASEVTKLTELNKEEITLARKWAAEHKAKPASNSFTAPLAEAEKTVITKRKIE
jgi:SpoVK/Ycf46/Vps4 family AAA+-type ATPase